MDRAAEGAPDVFQQQMEDLHRFIAAGVQAATDEVDDPAAQALLQGYRET
jgi:hypothetical protein